MFGGVVASIVTLTKLLQVANAKEMYRMDFESDLGDGEIEFYIYEFHIGVGFHPTYKIFKLNKENVE